MKWFNFSKRFEAIELSIKSKSFERIIKYSVSEVEPKAMFRKWLNSLSEFRPQPSLIFVGIEALALRNWDVRLYNSSLGKSLVIF